MESSQGVVVGVEDGRLWVHRWLVRPLPLEAGSETLWPDMEREDHM